MAEYPRVMDKTSKLSSAMRRTVQELMDSALRRLALKVFKELTWKKIAPIVGPQTEEVALLTQSYKI